MTNGLFHSMILEIKNLSKSFGPVKVLSDISFSLKEGRVLGLTGENGAGKTTLMRCISGLIRPNGGELILDGKSMSSHVSHLDE
jgi:ABC-type sugar transport system ATPase subunit